MRARRIAQRGTRLSLVAAGLALFVLSQGAARAAFDPRSIVLPPGFTLSTYVSGTGFGPKANDRGIPAIVAATFDLRGNLYFARTSNRLQEIYGRSDASVYRIPLGGATVTPETEAGFLLGPPLPDPHEVAVNKKGDVFVSASDQANGFGSVYRISPSGEAALFAGGASAPGSPPLLTDPQGIAFDEAENVYVIDEALGAIVKLDPHGSVLNPRLVSDLGRGRTLTFDARGRVWIGSDGPHNTPREDGSGIIFRASLPDWKLQRVHSGPLPSGMSLSPGGNLFVAQRRSGRIFALTPQGRRVEFASFGTGAALRTLAFSPVTPETRKAGIAGSLFVMVFPELDYPVREIIRISGPFDVYVVQAR
jgi:sugar lactone lactonase YvrE